MPVSHLPHTETAAPETLAQLVEVVRTASANRTPLYPIGGGTSLQMGLPGQREGIALQLQHLRSVLDYPARDMTITVESGITIETLRNTLAAEQQQLPVDAPFCSTATLGGLMATNHSGPLRFGHGTLRDYVIGVTAVDGRGDTFSAGGRVVKNVAGYDFCKLLTGSLGTLGVITEITLKLKPLPATRRFLTCVPRDEEHLEHLLASLMDSQTRPVAIELVAGSDWNEVVAGDTTLNGGLIVGFEGSPVDVDWMTQALMKEWKTLGVDAHIVSEEQTDPLLQQLVDFSADPTAAVVIQTTGVPSGTTQMITALRACGPAVEIQAHAGNGVVLAKFAEHPSEGLGGLMSRLRSSAAAFHGYAVVLSNPSGEDMTHQSVWGAANVPYDLMSQVKRAFDPHDILNPGRFVYTDA